MNDRERGIFRKYLERRGLKLTAERQAVFDELFARHEHFEADELLVRLRGESGYRYERLRAGEHHDHLICNECGRVIEFFEPRIEQLQDEVCERYGFLPLTHSHQMRGICRQCRPRAARQASERARGHATSAELPRGRPARVH